jgi:hypothetical protein
MKKHFRILLALFVFALIASCENNVEPKLSTDSFIGTWVESGNEDNYNIMVMTKADSLASDKYGFTFLANGEFIERKNSGWCGTPPISYGNFKGNWIKTSDSTIDIKVAFWGGQDTFSIVIVSLNSDKLKFSNKRSN